jgi:hypothetical protein
VAILVIVCSVGCYSVHERPTDGGRPEDGVTDAWWDRVGTRCFAGEAFETVIVPDEGCVDVVMRGTGAPGPYPPATGEPLQIIAPDPTRPIRVTAHTRCDTPPGRFTIWHLTDDERCEYAESWNYETVRHCVPGEAVADWDWVDFRARGHELFSEHRVSGSMTLDVTVCVDGDEHDDGAAP